VSEIKTYTEEYVPINGINQYFLHYPSSQNEVIIFLHGGPGTSDANFTYAFSTHYGFCNLVYYDQRGAGKTQRKNKSKPEELTIDILIEDLKQTICYIKEKYETDRIILLGQSWGTILGTEYIRKYPKDVICYIGAGHCVDYRRESRVIFAKLKELIENKSNKKDIKKHADLQNLPDMPIDAKGYLKKEVKFYLLRSKYGLNIKMGSLIKLALKSPIFKLSDMFLMLTATKTNIQLMKWMMDWSVWDKPDYSVPVYYILGRDDWQTPSSLAAEYFEKINAPQKGVFWIENAGHAANIDNPTDFYKVVKNIILQL